MFQILRLLLPRSITNIIAHLLPKHRGPALTLHGEGFCIAMHFDFTIRDAGYKLPMCGS